MFGIKELLTTFISIKEAVEIKKKANQLTPLDEKMGILAAKTLYAAAGFDQRHTVIRGVEIRYPKLCNLLSLADLKISMEYGDGLSKKIVEVLGLQSNFDQINSFFTVEERIRNISDHILQYVKLDEIRILSTSQQIENCSAWYALAPDDDFLRRHMSDLTKMDDCSLKVVSARISHLQKNTPEAVEKFRAETFTVRWFGNLNPTLGKLCTLTGKELNSIANQLPISACRLFSDMQIQMVDFSKFSDQQLKGIIYGDGSEKELRRRLDLLSRFQIQIFVNKPLGVFFDNLSHIQTGAFFDKLSDKQIMSLDYFDITPSSFQALFLDDRIPHPEKIRRIRLIPKELVSDLLKIKECGLLTFLELTDQQITGLDYSKITSKQVEALFLSYAMSAEERNRRIHLIPASAVNHVLAKNNEAFAYLSTEQRHAVNPEYLSAKSISDLFPGPTVDYIYPGQKHWIEKVDHQVQHHFLKSDGVQDQDYSMHPQEAIDEMIEGRQEKCQESVLLFTPDQLKKIEPRLYPEVRELLAEFLAARSIHSKAI